jgi:Fe-S-cluster-containing hydrogenase component 2
VARRRADYRGESSCLAAAQVAGGGKDCCWGCLGYGDCERLCGFDAIAMNINGLPVVNEDRCTACGDCVEGCPKDLFSLLAVDQRLWVRCKNEEQGDSVLAACEVACTGCARCAVDAPALVSMAHSLARVDYTRARGVSDDRAGRVAIERCPTGAIVWVDDALGDIKGRESARVIRHSPRPKTVT